MQNDYLTLALCKGNLLRSTLDLLAAVGLPHEGVAGDTRNLVFTFEDAKLKYLMCRPTDVPTYVEQGAADLGIVGKDVIVEQQKTFLNWWIWVSALVVLWWRSRNR